MNNESNLGISLNDPILDLRINMLHRNRREK